MSLSFVLKLALAMNVFFTLVSAPPPSLCTAVHKVFVPLIVHMLRHQVSEDRPGGHPGLGLQSARTLRSLAEGDHAGTNAALTALLTPGGLAVLRRSPEELVQVLRTPTLLETPRLIWGPNTREELEEMLKQVRIWGDRVAFVWAVVGLGFVMVFLVYSFY